MLWVISLTKRFKTQSCIHSWKPLEPTEDWAVHHSLRQIPLCRVVCEQPESHFYDGAPSLSPQLERISFGSGRPRAIVSMHYGRRGHSVSCKSDACPCHHCGGLDVSRRPYMAQDTPRTSYKQETTPQPQGIFFTCFTSLYRCSSWTLVY